MNWPGVQSSVFRDTDGWAWFIEAIGMIGNGVGIHMDEYGMLEGTKLISEK